MVQNSSQFQLLPVLIILIIGIVVIAAWLAWLLIRSREQDTSGTDMTQPQGTPASAEAHAPSAPSPAYVLGVKRDVSERWEVYVNGQPCRTFTAISDPHTRGEVTSALRALAGFAKGVTKESQSAVPPVKPTSPLTQRLAQPVQTTDAGSLAAGEPTTRRVTPLRGSLPTIDFAYEINNILTDLLAQAPALQDHTVVLQNIPGGINFFVDGAAYNEITDIPSTEIQALIRQATREWERR